jgi:nitrate reductase molybdenum cofactor assembly chaperone NarJ/NarW
MPFMKRGRERGRRSAVLQHRTVWQGSALLLVRPDDQFVARLETVEEMLGHLDAGYAMALGRAAAGLRRLDTRTAVLDHAQTFGPGTHCSLTLSHWLADDNRDRVVHRQPFVDAYRAAGVSPPGGAMPDHLSVVLEFAAHVDPEAGRRLLVDHRVPIAALQRALSDAGSPYAHAVGAVCATLPEVGAQDLQSVPGSGSTTEIVGPQHVHLDIPPN